LFDWIRDTGHERKSFLFVRDGGHQWWSHCEQHSVWYIYLIKITQTYHQTLWMECSSSSSILEVLSSRGNCVFCNKSMFYAGIDHFIIFDLLSNKSEVSPSMCCLLVWSLVGEDAARNITKPCNESQWRLLARVKAFLSPHSWETRIHCARNEVRQLSSHEMSSTLDEWQSDSGGLRYENNISTIHFVSAVDSPRHALIDLHLLRMWTKASKLPHIDSQAWELLPVHRDKAAKWQNNR
jgi:hypothetical protein